MSRLQRPVQKNKNFNPATKFLKWNSVHQCFQFYNKETREKVKVQLPFKFLFLEHFHTVKGWSNTANSGIWSNEVYSTKREIIEVKNSEGTICKGLYGKNKGIINSAGGKYHRSIYGMTPDGEIINLQLKGAVVGGILEEDSEDGVAVKGWKLFHSGDNKKKIQGVAHLLDNQWIEITDFKNGKKGTVNYNIPFFELGKPITKQENELAVLAAEKLQKYMDKYFSKEEEAEPVQEIEVDAIVDFSELDV